MTKKKFLFIFLLCVVTALVSGIFYYVFVLHIFNPVKEAKDFNIETIKSMVDFNQNGIDDYSDFVLGAREDAKNKPRYDGRYQENGYPPDDVGVCTDVIWRAFKNAGYSLRDMIDTDIGANIDKYPRVEGKPDSKIDFRRVPNLQSFFERHAQILTLDTSEIAEWQPGDIVTFGSNHVAMISDKRNSEGVPYIIHNAGQPFREEDALIKSGFKEISGHYRFDASKVDEKLLLKFE